MLEMFGSLRFSSLFSRGISLVSQFWSSRCCLTRNRLLCLTNNSWTDKKVEDNGQSEETRIEIPVDRLTIKFARSSGPGGQNVNKVNTKVDVRFHVPSADWLPERVRMKLLEKEKNRINKSKELIISSTKFRTQHKNLGDALQRLHGMIAGASYIPKGPTAEQQLHVKRLVKVANERRLRDKKFQSNKKRERQGQD